MNSTARGSKLTPILLSRHAFTTRRERLLSGHSGEKRRVRCRLERLERARDPNRPHADFPAMLDLDTWESIAEAQQARLMGGHGDLGLASAPGTNA